MKATGFGYKSAWIAAKRASPEAVAEALGLRNVRAIAWDAGLAAAEAEPYASVFVTPPIDGWVLGVGFALFALADARPPLFGRRAEEWAARLQTEVQYFATHRVVEAHAWARARPSGLERAYSYLGESGEKLLDEGHPTAEERAVGFARSCASRGLASAVRFGPGPAVVEDLVGVWAEVGPLDVEFASRDSSGDERSDCF